ncbi:MAG: O-antigen ligase family protein [Thermoflexales bacterium]
MVWPTSLRRVARAGIAWPALLVCVLVGVGVGAAVTLTNPLWLIAGLAGVLVAAWALADARRSLWLLLAVVALLPRFTLPLRLGFTPTFLDLALIGLLAAWGAHQLGPQPRMRLMGHVIALPLSAMVVIALVTFILGVPNGALTPMVLRRFAELALSLVAVPVLMAIFREPELLADAGRGIVLLGALSALIGIVLYFVPDDWAIRALSALRPFGYPTGPGVLRFIRDDPALMQRATGLWIDPNAFGGWLMVAGAFALPQVLSRQPLLPRAAAWLALGAIVLALALTVSRAAMLGLAVAAAALGLLRYRRALLLVVLGALAMLTLPQTRELVAHFAEGFAGRDLATQMRFGEYKDALRLIARYPLFGVGFVGTPDVDLYLGVSSMYLLIAQQTGLVGLMTFTALVLAALVSSVRFVWRNGLSDATLTVLLGAQGALLGVLFTGVFDHYFFNIDFHNAVIVFCLVIALATARPRDSVHGAVSDERVIVTGDARAASRLR